MNANSSRLSHPRKTSNRPAKPYKDFPLYAHPSGNWAKKIRGTFHYFGRWGRIRSGKMQHLPGDGWKEALELYKAHADDLHAGRKPRVTSDDGLTVRDLCNRFLTAKQRKMDSAELSPRSFLEYKQATDLIVVAFDKNRLVDDLAADDFESLRAKMAKSWGPARLGKFIQLIRAVFKYAVENNLIDRPVTFGSEFRKPDKSVLRKQKTASGKKLFTAAEVRQLLKAATPQLKAAILLGINAGLGNSDISGLKHDHLDLKKAWLDYPREKTGLPRRVPLWSKTVKTLKVAIAQRPKPKSSEDDNCVFLNRGGRRLVQSTTTSHSDYVTTAFGKLLRELKINGRKGLNFYSLRHSFATIALETGDRDAVKSLMGHAAHDMLAVYDEIGPNDDRLQAVVEHVRHWLFAKEKAK